jgi:threonylcarbamoyladenosine tRNA methylthiotransferase MtaB
MSHYILRTLGCKANLSDSQSIEQELQKQGWLPKAVGARAMAESSASQDVGVQLCIVNSCTVTDEADRQTKKMAARLAKENPNAVVVVTGCGAEVDPESFLKAKGVHYVVGNQNKTQLVDLVLNQVSASSITSDILKPSAPLKLGTVQNYDELISRHPIDREWPAATEAFQAPPTQLASYSKKTRAFLKIQEGCNSFCTYCIIPYGRGPGRSLRPREVVAQVQELVSSGIREMVITGTNIGDYGTDWGTGPALDDLLELIFKNTQIERVRVSSLDPTEVTPKMIEMMENEPRFCPHFHISLQSPHSRILKLMKRKYTYDEVKSCLERIAKIKAPLGGVFVGMDVITGFPGETEEEFNWTYEALSQLPWNRLHVFPYSERAGTPATRLPHSVPPGVRSQRAKKLIQLSMDRLTSYYRDVLGKCKKDGTLLDSILLEKENDSAWIGGYTPNYIRVLLRTDQEPGRKSELEPNRMISASPLDLIIDTQAGDVALVSTSAL